MGADQAQLTQPAIGADRGQVVDVGELGQLAGRRELLARPELTALDRGGDRVDELLGQRALAVAVDIGQFIFV